MLDRVCQVLEAVVAAGNPVSAADLSRLTGLPRPTSYRLVAALFEHGLLDSVEGESRYMLGSRFIRMALLGKTDNDLGKSTAAILKRLVAETGESAFLSRFRDGSIDLIHVEVPHDGSNGFIHPGYGTRPVHACSSAKAIAAYAQDEVRDQLLTGTVERFTDTTITQREKILDELELTRRRGYALCAEEIDEGVVSIAVPVTIEPAGVMFSLGVVGPARRMSERKLGELATTLKQASARAGKAIQHFEGRISEVPIEGTEPRVSA